MSLHPSRNLSRRRCLNILVKSAMAGMVFPVMNASAKFHGGSPADGYADFLRDLDLQYVKVDDIIYAHAQSRGATRNSLPPMALWRNIETVLKAADLAAAQLGTKRVRIISAYRSPGYNAKCSGASRGSMHMKNLALDLRYDAPPRKVVAVMRELRRKGVFSGGIGRYGSFTHIDGRGRNVDW